MLLEYVSCEKAAYFNARAPFRLLSGATEDARMQLIVTGGAGFIGSGFIRWALAAHPDVRILNLDKLTYAGNLENLASIENDPRYRFVRADICDVDAVNDAFEVAPDAVVHFAAESHVDRSILSPAAAVDTNVRGTFVLLEAARRRKSAASCTCRPTKCTAAWKRRSKPTIVSACGESPYSGRRRGPISSRSPT